MHVKYKLKATIVQHCMSGWYQVDIKRNLYGDDVAVPTLKFCQLNCGVECYCKSIRCVTYADKEETDTLSCNLKII